MAQEQDLTFITEDIPPATSFFQSGRGLRLSYMGRQEALYITEAIGKEEDPNEITEEEWLILRESWKKEAEVTYPDEGIYKVWLIDPVSKLPIPIGSIVEYIGDKRESKGKEAENPE